MYQSSIDELYNKGFIPDRYYNQLNGKSAEENYRKYKNKRIRLSKKNYNLETFIMSML